MALRPNGGHGLLILEVSKSHSDTPHSVGLLWTSDQLVAETSTCQHTTLTTDAPPALGAIGTHSPSQRATADPRAATGIGSLSVGKQYKDTLV